jgi:hypothetical protein
MPDFGVGPDLDGGVYKGRRVEVVVTVFSDSDGFGVTVVSDSDGFGVTAVSDSDGFGATVFSDSIVDGIIGGAHRVPLVLMELIRPLSIL